MASKSNRTCWGGAPGGPRIELDATPISKKQEKKGHIHKCECGPLSKETKIKIGVAIAGAIGSLLIFLGAFHVLSCASLAVGIIGGVITTAAIAYGIIQLYKSCREKDGLEPDANEQAKTTRKAGLDLEANREAQEKSQKSSQDGDRI